MENPPEAALKGSLFCACGILNPECSTKEEEAVVRPHLEPEGDDPGACQRQQDVGHRIGAGIAQGRDRAA